MFGSYDAACGPGSSWAPSLVRDALNHSQLHLKSGMHTAAAAAAVSQRHAQCCPTTCCPATCWPSSCTAVIAIGKHPQHTILMWACVCVCVCGGGGVTAGIMPLVHWSTPTPLHSPFLHYRPLTALRAGLSTYLPLSNAACVLSEENKQTPVFMGHVREGRGGAALA